MSVERNQAIYIYFCTWQRLANPPQSAGAGDQVNIMGSNTVQCSTRRASLKGVSGLNWRILSLFLAITLVLVLLWFQIGPIGK